MSEVPSVNRKNKNNKQKTEIAVQKLILTKR